MAFDTAAEPLFLSDRSSALSAIVTAAPGFCSLSLALSNLFNKMNVLSYNQPHA